MLGCAMQGLYNPDLESTTEFNYRILRIDVPPK